MKIPEQIAKQAKTKRTQLVVLGVAALAILIFGAICYFASPSAPEAAAQNNVVAEPSVPSIVAPPIQPILHYFNTDPDNKLPVMTLESLVAQMADTRSDFMLTHGDRFHLVMELGPDDVINRDSLFFIRSPQMFLQERINVTDVPVKELKSVNVGQRVEMVVRFDHYENIQDERAAGQEWFFRGEEIQILQ
jgi:hypothetical protein